MVLQHKCPNCGADMNFNAETSMLSCESCGTEKDIASMPSLSPDDVDETYGDYEEFQEDTTYNTFDESDSSKEYVCNNCGATLITTEDTAATTCSFCGSPMILGDRLSGKLAPAKVIPFKITKEQATEGFKKWCKKGLVTPKGFMNADRIKSITGIYVPFWLFDVNAQGDASATCTKVRSYTKGDYRYTETSYYDVYRKVDVNYLKIPADASTKMDDKLMDKLEPFHYNDLVDFNTPYLSGYIAEKYNYTDQDLFARIKERVDQYTDTYIRNTIHGYSSVNIRHKDINTRQRNADYVLFPVWTVCYDYEDAEHNFAMNGQTGKIVGKPPISKAKVLLWFLLFFAITFGITELINFFIGGSF